MTEARAEAPPARADLRWMRVTTAGTLWALVCVSVFVQLLLGTTGDPGTRMAVLVVATILSAVLALTVVPLLLRAAFETSARHPLVLGLLTVTIATWAVALVPPFGGWAWAFLLAITGGMLSCLVSRWWSAVVVAGTLGAIALGGISASAGSATATLAPTTSDDVTELVVVSTLALLTVMPLSSVWVYRVVLRLEHARQTASELAVATERLRFATDLHDIQGHHLQVIALKGELAERRLLAGQAALAAKDLAEIREIAQAALEDTRAVVNDYRTVTVAVEARNAAAVLRSAGIDSEARIDVADLPPTIGAVLAIAIREAATNILRHSKATKATLELVQLGSVEYRLSVVNNGSGPLRHGGTGLIGITERVAAFDGAVETRRSDDTFTLVVRIPVPAAQQPTEVER